VSGATYKDPENGLVLVDQEACIGCGYCVEACPYEARYLDESRGVVDKCTGCVQRLEREQQPACVATCVGGARMFGDLNDPNSEVALALSQAKSIKRLEDTGEGVDTGPNIYYINAEGLDNQIVLESGILPRTPHYTTAEEGWKKVLVPAVFAGIGASFLVQATYFSKQLIEGEHEFEE
jgi:tetrathionate reductase subunit B